MHIKINICKYIPLKHSEEINKLNWENTSKAEVCQDQFCEPRLYSVQRIPKVFFYTDCGLFACLKENDCFRS